MKKTLLIFTLLFSLHSFSQNSSFSNPVADALDTETNERLSYKVIKN